MIEGENQTFKTDKLTFILTPTRVLVVTPIGQRFYLSPKSHYYNRRLITMRTMIMLDEIRDLNELSEWCLGGKGIEWITDTSLFKTPTFELAPI